MFKSSVEYPKVWEYLYKYLVVFFKVGHFFFFLENLSIKCCNIDMEDTEGTKLKAGMLCCTRVVTWQSVKFFLEIVAQYSFFENMKSFDKFYRYSNGHLMSQLANVSLIC